MQWPGGHEMGPFVAFLLGPHDQGADWLLYARCYVLGSDADLAGEVAHKHRGNEGHELGLGLGLG